MKSTVFLSMGSNLGDREANLRSAVAQVAVAAEVCAVSSVYDTDPVGVAHQPEFLNLVVEARTTLTAPELLTVVKRIEQRVGRRPTFRWGPRVVDIDILLYDDLRLETPDLVIPHREMVRRAFVLVPLAEIAPERVHPVEGVTVAALLGRVAQESAGVRRLHAFDPTDIYTG